MSPLTCPGRLIWLSTFAAACLPCRVQNQPPETGPAASTAVPAAPQDGSSQATASSSRQEEQQQQASTSTLEELLQPRLPEGLGADEGVRDTLLVLKVLEAINRSGQAQICAIPDRAASCACKAGK